MEKEDCQLGPMSCQKKKKNENRMPFGGGRALLLCAFMQKPYITPNRKTKSMAGCFQTRLSGNFLISSGTFKDFKSCKSSEMH